MNKLLFTLVILFIGVLPQDAFAARLYVVPGRIEAQNGDVVQASVRLDVQQDEANTVEIRVEFPEDLLEFISYRDGGTIVNIWIEKPQYSAGVNCESGQPPCGLVIMSGIIPGGYTGDGLIADLEFRAKKNGNGKLDFLRDSKVFANTPDGQTLFTIINSAEFKISNTAAKGENAGKTDDKSAPEEFTVYLDKGASVSADKWFVAFSTEDKNSGIEYYEVKEAKLAIFGGEWKKVEGPYYILENQSLLSAITVRAVNNEGLSRTTTIFPPRLKMILGTLAGLSLVLLLWMFTRHMTRRFPLHPPVSTP